MVWGSASDSLKIWGRKCCIFLLLEPLYDPKICKKCVCGRGSAPDPAGGAHDAPPDPLVIWGGHTSSPHPIGDPHFLTNRTLYLWRLDRGPRQPSGPRALKHVKTALVAVIDLAVIYRLWRSCFLAVIVVSQIRISKMISERKKNIISV